MEHETEPRRRGGRPSLGDRVLIQCRVPRRTAERLTDLGEKAGQPRSAYAVAVLVEHVERQDAPDE